MAAARIEPVRIERDFLGALELPKDALYGIQSARARDNFALNYRPVNPRLLDALLTVKKAAALVWGELSPGEARKFDAVARACDALSAELRAAAEARAAGKDVFIVDALAGGAGTSVNMNINEAVANRALLLLGKEPGDYAALHPLDDVNRAQSTNDVYPTALRIASILLIRDLAASCAALQEALQQKENEFDGIAKLGRTELMDAVPVTLGSEFGAWAQAIGRDRWRLYKAEERLRQVNIGGAAVGLVPARESRSRALHQRYAAAIIERLRSLSGIGLAAAEYPMDITQNNDVFVEVSGLFKALSANILKIAGDVRLMGSGPAGGIGELRLAALQAGSTIMPGKVNPVIPEMAMQAAMRVQANDLAVTLAASRGEFELNAFLPLIADAFLESLSLLCRACELLREKCILTLEADEARCAAHLDSSLAFAASYIAALGYDEVARIAALHRAAGAAAVRAALEARLAAMPQTKEAKQTSSP
ncbi:MAG: aspartate ammonia-lyase [Spirochaetaceae bacterium]|jgi:aspartate ammonia-lyase|nr:aspartate ammonia-lyase [Spirochaetaceae bacterium]